MRADPETFSSHELDLLDGYLAGELSPERVDELCTLLTDVGADFGRLNTAAELLQAEGFAESHRHTAELQLAALHRRLGMQVPSGARNVSTNVGTARTHVRPDRPVRASRVGVRPSRIVAAFAAIAVLGIIFASLLTRRTSSAHVVERAYATARAQQATVVLPDGSTAHLAPETRLRYRATAQGERHVMLDGQAYFTVTHDPARRFTVQTGAVQTEVLGTAFDVRRYDTDLITRVTVADGKVATRLLAGAPRAPTVLTPGVIGLFTDSTATIARADDSTATTAWTQGRLIFTKIPVPEMLETLGRWYGYRFRLTDSTFVTQHVSAVVLIDQPQQMMATLKALLGVTMTFDGNTILLRQERRPQPSDVRTRRDTFSTLRMEEGR